MIPIALVRRSEDKRLSTFDFGWIPRPPGDPVIIVATIEARLPPAERFRRFELPLHERALADGPGDLRSGRTELGDRGEPARCVLEIEAPAHAASGLFTTLCRVLEDLGAPRGSSVATTTDGGARRTEAIGVLEGLLIRFAADALPPDERGLAALADVRAALDARLATAGSVWSVWRGDGGFSAALYGMSHDALRAVVEAAAAGDPRLSGAALERLP